MGTLSLAGKEDGGQFTRHCISVPYTLSFPTQCSEWYPRATVLSDNIHWEASRMASGTGWALEK